MSTALTGLPPRVTTTRKLDAAMGVARRAHRGQRREPGGAPYLEHVWEVAALVRLAGEPEDSARLSPGR
jgi:(p)ppGpp synthase/HD superfamily hydrolase